MALKEYSRIQKLHSKLLVLLYIFPSNSVRMHFQSSYFLNAAMYETELQKKKRLGRSGMGDSLIK